MGGTGSIFMYFYQKKLISEEILISVTYAGAVLKSIFTILLAYVGIFGLTRQRIIQRKNQKDEEDQSQKVN